jgi:hypothetical protein
MTSTQKSVTAVVILTVLVLAGAGIIFGPWIRKEYLANTFEERAKDQVTAEELQAWATNLLASGRSGRVKVQDAGPDFPSKLTNLYPKLPSIYVYDRESPGFVMITWGGGMIGSWGFRIGPTNLVIRGDQWAPGVFFMPKDGR